MITYNPKLAEFLLSLNRYLKKTIAAIVDVLLAIISVWLSFVILLEDFIAPIDLIYEPFVISVLTALPIFWFFGLYKSLFRYQGLSIFFKISLSALVYGFFYFFIVVNLDIENIPKSIGIIQPILFFCLLILSRLLSKFILTGTFENLDKLNKKKNILIYGAGSGGSQIYFSLENNSKYNVVGFLDDNLQKQNQYLMGKKIFNPKKIKNLIINKEIKLILIAIPSINIDTKNKIIDQLFHLYNLPVKTLPNINDIIDGKISSTDIKDFLIEDVLDRKEFELDKKLQKKTITNKNILITGAGGTIGSELCRQIAKLKPNNLILCELNEFFLYKINEELTSTYKNLKVFPILVNCQNEGLFDKIVKKFNVNYIYHAAAYKHVNLVEANICEGVKNNVFTSLTVAKVAANNKVKNITLISSDKAVNPVSVMGASKRLSELCFQAYNEEYKNLNFSIVRFGNVLASSGSIVPKIQNQISLGGPITLTDPEVSRYFMTIKEATELVILSSIITSDQNNIFVLDMGKRIKILDLINKLVRFSGLKIKNKENPYGDIEVKVIGLRPGEKLHEELLVGKNPIKTSHPKILKLVEPLISLKLLKIYLDELSVLLNNNEPIKVQKFLEKIIPNYKADIEITNFANSQNKM